LLVVKPRRYEEPFAMLFFANFWRMRALGWFASDKAILSSLAVHFDHRASLNQRVSAIPATSDAVLTGRCSDQGGFACREVGRNSLYFSLLSGNSTTEVQI